MEYVSVLAGVRFSDRPRCTDPTLAAIARLVNDTCTDAGRQRLGLLAPDLVQTPRGDAVRTAAVVRSVVRAACASVGTTPSLRRHLRRAERRQETVTGTGWRGALARHLDRLYGQGPGRHAMEVSVRALGELTEAQRDDALVAMLATAVAAARSTDGNRSQRQQGHRAEVQAPPPAVV
jgi:hypothetical protein